MKRLLLALLPLLAYSQVQTIPNTTFPAVRTLLNSNFNYISTRLVTPGTCPSGQYATAITLSGITCAEIAGGGSFSGAVACAGTPGDTTADYRQQCQDTDGAIYACNNASGCTVTADWVAVGAGEPGPPGAAGSLGSVIAYAVNHTTTADDCGNWIAMKGTGLTLTLKSPPRNPCQFAVQNLSASSTLTISRNGLTINDVASNITIDPCSGVICQAVSIWTDGTNYFASKGPKGDTGNTGAAGANGAISIIQVNGVSQTVRAKLNFSSNVTCSDNPANNSTDCSATGGGGGGSSTTQGTYASIPVTCTLGDLYLLTDSYYDFARCIGSNNIDLFSHGKLMYKPSAQTWGWKTTQGSASVNITNGGIALIAPGAASNNLRMYGHTAPATPWTVTAYVIPSITTPTTSTLFPISGIALRESGTGKIYNFAVQITRTASDYTATRIDISHWASATSFGASDGDWVFGFQGQAGIWLKVGDDGTNLSYAISSDGVNFSTLTTIARGAYFSSAPDQVGILANTNDSAANVITTVLSWRVQ